MKTRVFNLIILDESGSMTSIEKQALDGVNESFQSIQQAQKENPDQEHFITFVTFNDDVHTICDCIPADKAMLLTSKDYNPNCCTALLDAMGQSLNYLRRHVAEADRVLVTIITDGYENASKEYNSTTIKTLVDELKTKGWVFSYIGANQDVEKISKGFSIDNFMEFSATADGTEKMMKKLHSSRKKLFSYITREHFDAEEANQCFFKNDEKEENNQN